MLYIFVLFKYPKSLRSAQCSPYARDMWNSIYVVMQRMVHNTPPRVTERASQCASALLCGLSFAFICCDARCARGAQHRESFAKQYRRLIMDLPAVLWVRETPHVHRTRFGWDCSAHTKHATQKKDVVYCVRARCAMQ